LRQFSFQGIVASFNAGPAPATVTFPGTRCSADIRGPWTVTNSFGAQSAQRQLDLTSGSATFQIVNGLGGEADGQLQLSAGPPATISLSLTLTGSYNSLSVNPPQAPVTATRVASC
jgi:hypothetical protein